MYIYILYIYIIYIYTYIYILNYFHFPCIPCLGSCVGSTLTGLRTPRPRGRTWTRAAALPCSIGPRKVPRLGGRGICCNGVGGRGAGGGNHLCSQTTGCGARRPWGVLACEVAGGVIQRRQVATPSSNLQGSSGAAAVATAALV